MHLKRHKAPKNWPIKRKGTKFVVRPSFNPKQGVPILIILRDMLKICQNRKEVKKAIQMKHILQNNKKVKDDKNNVLLFDTITIIPTKKSYKLDLSKNGKFKISEINEADANSKISKVVNKKVLKGKRTQLNLSDGMNFISGTKCNINDSVLIDFKGKKIEKCLPLKEKSDIFIFRGKHAGKKGVVRELKAERKMASVTSNKKELNVLIKQLMVIK